MNNPNQKLHSHNKTFELKNIYQLANSMYIHAKGLDKLINSSQSKKENSNRWQVYLNRNRDYPTQHPINNPYVTIIQHPANGRRSVIVSVHNFIHIPSKRMPMPHVEILNQGGKNRQFLPNIGSTYEVGPLFKRVLNNGIAWMRKIPNLQREDGQSAHITVFWQEPGSSVPLNLG